ncbi:MAG: PQQ-dependent sugar dehydrogenase [Chloroflexi bacterium]|nr:PQQ-dependent sugar dehydrogenase [Chloroflexota bacterium]
MILPLRLLPVAALVLVAVIALAAVAPAPNAALPTLELERIFPSLTFERPVLLTHAGDGTGRVYVVEQHGVVRRIDPAVPDRTEPFLDISARVSRRGNEEGLLGLAFDPGFIGNGRFYVYYSAASPRRSVLSRFETGPTGLGESASESVLLEVPQPYSNHNGGMIALGPDGMLYVALGDGGSAGDPQRHGQDIDTLLGTILRIDVTQPEGGAPYAIPADNPFAGRDDARGEIWAFGLRNAWRFSFDRETGDLWAGDVGQNELEEVDVVRRGGNYGWNVMEGSRCFRPASCDASIFEAPVVEYGRDFGCSITGGYVYRGQRLPELRGVYLYADYCSGRIWGLRWDGERVTEQAQLARATFQVPSFGEDEAGEVYVLGFDGGIYTFAGPPGQPAQPTVPTNTPVPAPTSADTPTPSPALTATLEDDATINPAPTPMPTGPTAAPTGVPSHPATPTPDAGTTPTPEPPPTSEPAEEPTPAPEPAGGTHMPSMSDGAAWGLVAQVVTAALLVALFVSVWRRCRRRR